MDDKHLIVVLVLAILFGVSRLPLLGRNVGQGIQEFGKSIASIELDGAITEARAFGRPCRGHAA